MGGLTFGKDGDGNCGYYGADGSLIPFKQENSFCGIVPMLAMPFGVHWQPPVPMALQIYSYMFRTLRLYTAKTVLMRCIVLLFGESLSYCKNYKTAITICNIAVIHIESKSGV